MFLFEKVGYVSWMKSIQLQEWCLLQENKSSQNIKQGPHISSDWNVDFGDANEGLSLWEDLFGSQESAIQTYLYIYTWIYRNWCILCIQMYTYDNQIKYVYIYISTVCMSVYVTSLCRVCLCCCLCWFCVWVRLGASAWVIYPGQQKTHETSESFEKSLSSF